MTPEDQLEFCLQEVAAGRKTVAECAALFPETPDLETRLGVAQALKAWTAAELGPGARQIIEQRLRERLLRRPLATRPAPWFNRLRLAWPIPTLPMGSKFALATGLALILVVSLLGGGGLVYAANDALPGDALYPVKTTVEAARLALASSETAAVTLRLEFIEQRLDETDALLEANRAARVPQALEQYAAEVQATVTVIETAPGDSAAQQVRGQAQAALQAHLVRLDELSRRVPSQAQEALGHAQRASSQALEELGTWDAPTAAPKPKLTPEARRTEPSRAKPTRHAEATWTFEPTQGPGSTEGGDQDTRMPKPTDKVQPTHSAPKPMHKTPPTPVPGSMPGNGNGQSDKPSRTPESVPVPNH